MWFSGSDSGVVGKIHATILQLDESKQGQANMRHLSRNLSEQDLVMGSVWRELLMPVYNPYKEGKKPMQKLMATIKNIWHCRQVQLSVDGRKTWNGFEDASFTWPEVSVVTSKVRQEQPSEQLKDSFTYRFHSFFCMES